MSDVARPALPLLALATFDAAAADALAARWTPLLTASERRRLERIERPQRRAQFLAAHALARLAAAAAGADMAAVRIDVADDGRPTVVAPAGFVVSLAHSGASVVALLAQGTASSIGVDIEAMRADRDIVAIVEAACAVVAETRDRAYRIWATHEARLKAGSPETTIERTIHPAARTAWHAAIDGHALAVAGLAAPPAIWRFDVADPARPPRCVAAPDWLAAPG